MSVFRSVPRIGVALAPRCLTAVTGAGDRRDVPWDGDVAAAFAALRSALGLDRARVTVALVPPLVELRRLTLPPLPLAELRRILARDAARYFLNAREPLVASVQGAFAAAASRALVEAIERGVAEAGWTLDAVRPAHGAWLAAEPGADEVAVVLDDHAEVLKGADGVLTDLRRFPARNVAVSDADPMLVAARHAGAAWGPELVSDRQLGAVRRRERRLAGALAAAAAACLVLAALVELWGQRRELAALRERRSAIQGAVAEAMAVRDSLGVVRGALTTLAGLEATAPRWSALLTDVADHLPSGAYLVAARAAGDSVVLQGIAREAAAAFEGIRQMLGVAGVRAEAPIRQTVGADGTVREHFALGARVRP